MIKMQRVLRQDGMLTNMAPISVALKNVLVASRLNYSPSFECLALSTMLLMVYSIVFMPFLMRYTRLFSNSRNSCISNAVANQYLLFFLFRKIRSSLLCIVRPTRSALRLAPIPSSTLSAKVFKWFDEMACNTGFSGLQNEVFTHTFSGIFQLAVQVIVTVFTSTSVAACLFSFKGKCFDGFLDVAMRTDLRSRKQGKRIHYRNRLSFHALFLCRLPGEQGYSLFTRGNYSHAMQPSSYYTILLPLTESGNERKET